MNLPSVERKDIEVFHIEKIDIMSSHVDTGEKKHTISGNLVKPNVFIERDEVVEKRRPNHTDKITAHWKKNHGAIESKNTTSTTRGPNRELQTIQERQMLVILLLEKTVNKQEYVKATVD